MTTLDEIKELLNKNKVRFLKELEESREVVHLVQKSRKIALTEAEKTKVKAQLLDICKAIPSFAVFMLPGGALLLPLLIQMVLLSMEYKRH